MGFEWDEVEFLRARFMGVGMVVGKKLAGGKHYVGRIVRYDCVVTTNDCEVKLGKVW